MNLQSALKVNGRGKGFVIRKLDYLSEVAILPKNRGRTLRLWVRMI